MYLNTYFEQGTLQEFDQHLNYFDQSQFSKLVYPQKDSTINTSPDIAGGAGRDGLRFMKRFSPPRDPLQYTLGMSNCPTFSYYPYCLIWILALRFILRDLHSKTTSCSQEPMISPKGTERLAPRVGK